MASRLAASSQVIKIAVLLGRKELVPTGDLMSDLIKVVFGYGATERKTQWKRIGRLRNPSMERGNEGVRSHGLYVAGIGSSYPFAFTVTLTVPAEEQEQETAAKAGALFLEQLPGHSLVD